MTIYAVNFNPLCSSKKGKDAIEHYDQLKFVDSSSRREPELESNYASISSLCRGEKLTSKLEKGDIIIYFTRNGCFNTENLKLMHLVAILEVDTTCANHEEAWEWYKSRGLKIPSNCMYKDNPPLPYKYFGINCEKEAEDNYKTRSIKFPKYFICNKLFCDLKFAKGINIDELRKILGNFSLQSPKVISNNKFSQILKLYNISL